MPDQVRHDGELDVPAAAIEALAATAAALGIDSARAPLFALRAARASARLAGRDTIEDADLTLAARLVLAPRATRMPMEAEQPQPDAPPEPPPETDNGDEERAEPGPFEDVVLAAALASLPKDVLARIAAGGSRAKATRAHGAGERRKSSARGRPMGTRAGVPGGGKRLSLIDTLRAAAPWQRLRGREDRILVRRDDLRIRRFETRAEALTIFAVDASGSSALARLAEAKGAVELLLAEAYVKRAQVALVAFRGTVGRTAAAADAVAGAGAAVARRIAGRRRHPARGGPQRRARAGRGGASARPDAVRRRADRWPRQYRRRRERSARSG